jgi:hypothetical protein
MQNEGDDVRFDGTSGALPSVYNYSRRRESEFKSKTETAGPPPKALPKQPFFKPSNDKMVNIFQEGPVDLYDDTNEDQEDDDDFNEEEQEELTRTAAEFARKLKHIQAIQEKMTIFEGGEDSTKP